MADQDRAPVTVNQRIGQLLDEAEAMNASLNYVGAHDWHMLQQVPQATRKRDHDGKPLLVLYGYRFKLKLPEKPAKGTLDFTSGEPVYEP